jgi:hypothetical protein
MKKILFSALAAAILATGCAATETSTEPAAERSSREYTTGSNIPRKSRGGAGDGVTTVDAESFERARNAGPATAPGRGQ